MGVSGKIQRPLELLSGFALGCIFQDNMNDVIHDIRGGFVFEFCCRTTCKCDGNRSRDTFLMVVGYLC